MTLVARLKKRRGELTLDISLQTERTLLLIGPNGGGKTSLLLMLLGILRPDEGTVRLGETTLFDGARIDQPPERRAIGYVPQDEALFPHLTALENVAFGPRALGTSSAEARKTAIQLMEELGIGSLEGRLATRLSGGERQKVALARALATRPRALLLDEPLTALDAEARRSARTFLFERLTAFAGPSIVVLHDRKDVEALQAPVAVIDAGRIVQQGLLQEIREDPKTAYARNFTQAET